MSLFGLGTSVSVGPQGQAGPNWNIRNLTFADSPVTAAANDWCNCDTTSGPIAVTVPSASKATAVVKKTSSDVNGVTVSSASGLLDGVASKTLAVQWAAYTTVGQGASVGAFVQG